MKALTSTAPKSSERSKKSQNDKTQRSSHDEGSESEDQSNAESSSEQADDESSHIEEENEDSQIQHLRSQIFTLTTSLSTVTEEKAKIVATYQADKKNLKQEHESQMKMLKEENSTLAKKWQGLEDEFDKTRERVRIQQADREQEQATHSIMLREIQRMLNDERTKNDNLEAVIKELRSAAQNADQEAQQNTDYKWRVNQLEEELHEVRNRLHTAETEANIPSPLLLQLQEEMEKMKLEHKRQLELERHHVEEVEMRERQIAKNEEERVADLENRLVQISNKLGMYDGSRQKDQLSIQKLKDRISQLDVENTLLSKQLDAFKLSKKEDMSLSSLKSKLEEALDIDGLKEQLVRYQQLLKEAAAKSNEPVDLTDVVMSFQSEDYQKLYLESQQELLQLKEEFERYKTRAQNVLKNMKGGHSSSGGGAGCNREQEELKRQLQEARERHFHLRATCDDAQEKSAQLVVEHQRELEKLAAVHRAELESQQEKHNRRITEVEREIRSQRERTVAMLADKDKEIKHLKAYTSAFSR
uniref:GRIP and coiled-coil domain-containing protein 1-like n=1 Tax=Phallusia mammillata TaxID=59560 RepID=A0A6F9DE81_9ASCI|nr:GRIP and coiled-coil domain-containing protein 1-like [Phallusia mammillata]